MINVHFNPQFFQNLHFYFYLFYSSVPTDGEIMRREKVQLWLPLRFVLMYEKEEKRKEGCILILMKEEEKQIQNKGA